MRDNSLATVASNGDIQAANFRTTASPFLSVFARPNAAADDLAANNNASTSVIIGHGAGNAIPSGSQATNGNVLVGVGAGQSLQNNTALSSNGSNNVFIGANAGQQATTMEQGVFIGPSAGRNATTGIAQVMIGESAGLNVTTGQGNVLIGSDAGRSDSTDVGGKGITTGDNNIAIGQNAGATDQASPKDQTGSDNIAIGSNTDWMANPATNRTVIGNGAQSTADNEIMLGTSAMTVVCPGDIKATNISTGTDTHFLTLDAGNVVRKEAVGLGTTASPLQIDIYDSLNVGTHQLTFVNGLLTTYTFVP